MPPSDQQISSAVDYNPAVSSNQMEDYYRRQLQNIKKWLCTTKKRKESEWKKEQGEFEKRKQEFELQCDRERTMLNVEKNLEPKQSTPHFVHPTRYRNRNSFTNTANESNQKLKNGS